MQLKTQEPANWNAPQITTGLDAAFGGDMEQLLPPYDSIPKEFWDHRNEWAKIQSTWFYKGLPEDTKYSPKDGIDTDTALRHLAAIQRSFQPKHEHKSAGVAYLMSLWFDKIELPQHAEGEV